MTATKAVLVCLLITLAAGCASTPAPPVRVRGALPDMRQLEGDWRGHYSSVESGRRGRIRFSLESDEESARGDVLMFPRNRAGGEPGELHDGRDEASYILRILFVQVDEQTVNGMTEMYRDPECRCLVATSFTGALETSESGGERIEGVYISRGGPDHVPHSGRWWVERRLEDS